MDSLSQRTKVLHVWKESNCVLPCPTFKAHKDNMHKEESTIYLGSILSFNGSLSANIENRRNKGWGKISSIMGILSEVDMGVHQLEAGLRLREAILISSLLYSAEAWSNITEKQFSRIFIISSLRKWNMDAQTSPNISSSIVPSSYLDQRRRRDNTEDIFQTKERQCKRRLVQNH